MRLSAVIALVIVASASAEDVAAEDVAAEDVAALLDPIREQHGLPALAAASIVGGKMLDAGACGLRRIGGTERATLDDQWHLGSCTKSMTSSVAAMLVERGTLRWDATAGEIFPKMETMNAAWRSVTLEQLLSHRAGAPHEPPPPLWAQAWMRRGSPREQRMEFVRGLLQTPPDPPAGTKFVYSNQGYSIAGAMIERATDKPWETLMRELLFRPLAMTSAGFGAAGTAGKEDQPWGHHRRGSSWEPVPPGPDADNPPATGPGGIVHMSIGDFARYAAWHADEARRDGKLIKAESFQKLHTAAEGQDYALGWNVTKRPWAGGRVLTHSGSNTMNLAVMWVAPERDFAVVAATNAAGPDAEKGCDEAVAILIRRWEAGRR